MKNTFMKIFIWFTQNIGKICLGIMVYVLMVKHNIPFWSAFEIAIIIGACSIIEKHCYFILCMKNFAEDLDKQEEEQLLKKQVFQKNWIEPPIDEHS